MRPRSPAHDALGRVLRERRDQLADRTAQEDLGSLADVERSYFSEIERGEANPSFAVLGRVAAGLDMPLSEVFAEFERRVGWSELSRAERLALFGPRARPGPKSSR